MEDNDEVKSWAGAFENYSITENNGISHLDVEMDCTEQFKDYLDEKWPKALVRLKELAEY